MKNSTYKVIGSSVVIITVGAIAYKYIPEVFYNEEFKKSYTKTFKKVSESVLADICKTEPENVINKMFLVINRIKRLKV